MRQTNEVDSKTGGDWTGVNIKRDAGALASNKVARILVAAAIIVAVARLAFPDVAS